MNFSLERVFMNFKKSIVKYCRWLDCPLMGVGYQSGNMDLRELDFAPKQELITGIISGAGSSFHSRSPVR